MILAFPECISVHGLPETLALRTSPQGARSAALDEPPAPRRRCSKVCGSPRDPIIIWRKPKEQHETRGFSARFYLWKNLFTPKLADYRQHNEKAKQLYTDTYQNNCQRLHSSGAEVNTEVEASILLNGPDSASDRFIVATMLFFYRQNGDYNSEININHPIYQPATR